MAYPQFQPAQMNSLRILNKRHAENMQRSMERSKGGAKTSTKAANSWRVSTYNLVQRFANRTTIHGMSRLFCDASGRYERSIWLLTVVLALMGAIYVSLILSDRFNEGKFETVIDSTRMPVYRINFPTVTICNLNHLNWQRLDEAKRRFLPGERSPLTLELFERVIATYDDLSFANFEKFSVLEGEPLGILDNVNFSLVFDFMTWRCEEFLMECIWRHLPMNCCEIFSKRRSKNGLCWSFNTLETVEGLRMQRLDPKWPWRSGSAGPTSGLNVRVLIHPEKHYPKRINEKGLHVMVTEALVWHKEPYEVAENTATILQIEPIIYFYDNETRAISSEQRQCVFLDENSSSNFKTLQGYVYMIENCQAQCHQEYIVRFCNCTMDLLFPPGPYRSCKAKDLPCLARNNEFFRYSHQPGEEEYVTNYFQGMVCKCFRNCYSLNFFTDVRPTFLPAEVRNNLSYVDLDVHFRFDSMMVYRTSLVFGWVDLMVAFGGIAGLFLGCSLISGMELAYFVVIEVPTFVFEKLTQQWRLRRDMWRNPNYGISNRMLAAEQLNQQQFVINSNQGGPILHVVANNLNNDMHWKPQKTNRKLIQVNE